MKNPFYKPKKNVVYHPKYKPTNWTTWVKNEPTPNPFNPLYNGRPRFTADNDNRAWYIAFMVLASLLVMNYIKLVRQQQFELKENEVVAVKKTKYEAWRSDTFNRDITLVPYEILDKNSWVAHPMQKDSIPRGYQIVERPTRPPMPYDLATVQQSAREYIASKRNIPTEMSIVTSKSVRSTPNNDPSLGGDMVFVGSFDSRDHAESLLQRLKTIGYDRAEIVMKEKLPHLIVVTGFNYREQTAASVVKSLRKTGITAYAAETNWREIYRNKNPQKRAKY